MIQQVQVFKLKTKGPVAAAGGGIAARGSALAVVPDGSGL